MECGAEIDPWWWIRRFAAEAEKFVKTSNAEIASYERWRETAVANAKAITDRLNKEIADLTALKNRLQNEQVDGKPLGSLVRSRRRR